MRKRSEVAREGVSISARLKTLLGSDEEACIYTRNDVMRAG